MLPEIAAYFSAMEDDNYYGDRRQVQEDNEVPDWSATDTPEERAEYYAASQRLSAALLQLDHDAKERQALALDGLRESSDPFVQWVSTSQRWYGGYREHIQIILRAWPLSRTGLDDLRDMHGWCSDYNSFIGDALRAGVCPEYDKDIAEIDPLVSDLLAQYGYGADAKRKLTRIVRQHLPALIESARVRESVPA